MNQEIMDAGNYLVYLIRCVLHGEEAREKPAHITYEALYRMAKKHNIESMVFAAIEQYLQRDMLVKWQAAVNQNILKSILQDEAEKEIVGAFTCAGVKVLPLKGSVLKHLYPQEDFRQMSDIDLLYEAGKGELVKEIMDGLGYENTVCHKDYLMVYKKPPYISIDLPSVLSSGSSKKAYYFSGIWERLMEDKEQLGRYYMKKEDFLIHMLAHHAKHHYEGGCGIRAVADIYVYYEKYGEVLDHAQIECALREIELYEFHKEMLGLAHHWFGDLDRSCSESEWEEVAYYIYRSGSYGTQENVVMNALAKTEGEAKSRFKIMYCMRRVFKPFQTMCNFYPYLKNVPVLYPLCCLHRLVKMACNGSGRVKNEVRLVWKMKQGVDE